MRAHTKAPHKTDPLWKTLRALKRLGRARTGADAKVEGRAGAEDGKEDPAPGRAAAHLAAGVKTSRSTLYFP
jgi:hypothetical protein